MSKSSTTQFLALSCVGAIAFATATHAQEKEQPRKLGGMTVTDAAIDDEPKVKVDKPASPKYTAPLVDTPQTITVISRANIEQQNLLTLRDVLSTVPGITYAAGEGGFGYADNIMIMGVDARNDITVNGVRSSSNVTRNETYNIEQVEVTTGANSVYSGGGNVAGSINLVTKAPLVDDKIIVTGGIGTDNYWRGTVDINKRLNDLVAVRLNGVYHQNDVPGRDREFSDRWGVAPSVRIGLDGPTSLVLQYEHLEDNALPFYGVPYFPQRGGLQPGVSRSAYFGIWGADKQNNTTDAAQVVITHEFSDTLRIRSLNRYENVVQDTVTTNPGGTYCLAGPGGVGYNPNSAAGTFPACTAGLTANTYQANNPTTANRGTARYIHNETLSSQLDLSGTLNTGGIEHTFNLGASYLWENFDQTAYGSVTRPPAGGWPVFSTLAGSPLYTGPIIYTKGTTNFGTQEVFAGYLFDTMKFTDWLQVNAGARYEHVKGKNYDQPIDADRTNQRGISDNLFSYRVGVVVKPLDNVSLYVAYGNAKKPSQSSVSTGCTQVVNGTANTCTTKPEGTKTYEIGAKAELFEKALLLSAALYRNDRDTIRVASGEIGISDQILDGKERAQGFTLGAVGNITPNWSISANFMYTDAYTRQSVSDYCLANPGQGTCTNTVQNPDPLAGSLTASTPQTSGNIFTSYRFPFGLEVGYGANYQGSIGLNRFNLTTPAAALYRVPSYVTQRLMIAYSINDRLKAQVNVQNLFDKEYLTTVRTATGTGASWGQPGATRQAVFTLTGTF